LWLEKTALLVFGASEWSVHLFPFLAGLLSLLIFWHMCRTSFSPVVAGLAVAILAVSYYPVRHSAEVKPYAFDLMFAATFAWLALEHLRNPTSTRWLIALLLVAPIAVFSSYPSVFVGGAVSLVLLPTMRAASWSQRGLYLLFNFLLCGSFLLHYGVVGHGQVDAADAERTREFLRDYWKDAFPPDALSAWPMWLVKVFTGNMLAYPIGANKGGSTLTFLAVVVGSAALWRSHQRSLLALCWLPFALNLSAAIPHKYPFGDSARITLHLAPFICILAAHGIAHAIDWIRIPKWRTRCEFGLYVILLACGVVGVARDVRWPFKTEHDRDVRQLVLDLCSEVADGEPVFLCHERDEALLAEFLWYLRTRPLHVDWLNDASLAKAPTSCWLVMCGNHEPSLADVRARLPSSGWRMLASDLRIVPPENKKMPPMFCRKVHVARDESASRAP
jgi:4-amino-4-deoxy-L-arabinose transferase-like glycosyltransferase